MFDNKGEAFDTLDKIYGVGGVNSIEIIALLKQIKPDAILIYGTSVVVERYLAGKLQAMAQDISFGREYRGSDLTLGPELIGRLRMRQMRRNSRRRLMPASGDA